MDAVSTLGEQRPTLDGLIEALSLPGVDLREFLDPRKPLPTPPICENVEAYLKHLASNGHHARVLANIGPLLKRVIDACEMWEAADLVPSLVEWWLGRRTEDRGLSKATVTEYRRVLREFSRWLVQSARLSSDPLSPDVKEVPVPEPTSNGRIRKGTAEEERAIVYLKEFSRRLGQVPPLAQVAKAMKVHRQTPSGWKRFMVARGRLLNLMKCRKENPYKGRGWFWLDRYEGRKEVTEGTPKAILLEYNALPEERRMVIDPKYFATLAVGTDAEIRRSTATIKQCILRAREIRERDTNTVHFCKISKGSFVHVCRLFELWYEDNAGLTFHSFADIRDRWEAMPRKVRIAIGGRCREGWDKLHSGERGRQQVRQRIQRAKAEAAARTENGKTSSPEDRRAAYFCKLLLAGGMTEEKVYRHWDRELSILKRQEIDPVYFRPVGSARRVRLICGAYRRATENHGISRFAANYGKGETKRGLIARAAADPRGTLDAIQRRARYELGQCLLWLYESADSPARGSFPKVLDCWNGWTQAEREDRMPRFMARWKASEKGAFPKPAGLGFGASRVFPADAIPCGPGARTSAVAVVKKHVFQAKLDREIEEECHRLLADQAAGDAKIVRDTVHRVKHPGGRKRKNEKRDATIVKMDNEEKSIDEINARFPDMSPRAISTVLWRARKAERAR